MLLFPNTHKALAESKAMAEKLTFEDAARRLGWLALFAALFVLAGTPLLSWIGAAPLVLAAVLALCIRTLHAATKGQDPDFPATSVIAILAFSVGLALIFLVVNDPLWVKRTVSVIAALIITNADRISRLFRSAGIRESV